MLGKMGKTDMIYPVSHLAIPVQADTMPVFKCCKIVRVWKRYEYVSKQKALNVDVDLT